MSKDKAAAETKSLPTRVLELEKQLDKELTAAGINDKGRAKVGRDVFIANLPEGLTEKAVKTLNEYEEDYAAASLKVAGAHAQKFHTDKKNKEVTKSEFSFGMVGKDSVRVSYVPSREVPDMSEGAAKDARVTAFGVTRVQIDKFSTRGKAGPVAHIRDMIAESAREAFQGKK